MESARIYHFKGISRGNRRFCSTTEMPKLLVFQRLTALGIRFFEPGGRRFESVRAHLNYKKVFRRPGPPGRKRAVRTADRQTRPVRQPGARAGLDVAAPAVAVRSEAEDERRSREQSLRAHFLSKGFCG